jgi:hypothetical protein
MIKAYVRVRAPGIQRRGLRHSSDGSGYDLWLKLNPKSTIKQVLISQADYKTYQWADEVDGAIDDINP